jgi:hypothetical protein
MRQVTSSDVFRGIGRASAIRRSQENEGRKSGVSRGDEFRNSSEVRVIGGMVCSVVPDDGLLPDSEEAGQTPDVP